ncbi:synaptic vesicle glycoprotein 2B-like isoform X1 [Trichogramma pretiosum]|uniref:synaptic vesicle glycoprotein 2B-like isoform X1 n=1 Tax=Trichogramma pretiosum TaxID=7493 RepID=UPI0006C99948|nr:synaptic vesicle glycoprotein 2B-like isoform X1 [Trichogramma pretiosum]
MELETKDTQKSREFSNKNRDGRGSNFEEAISACGYGKFHYLLLLVIIPASWASVLDSSNMSMILPSAECDLDLTLYHKGILNGISYAGMVSSALLWGFMADVFGRRPILLYGFLADGICNLLCGFSQNFATIVIFKFISGFIVSGPYATIMTYCAEFYCTKDRPRITLAIGFTCFAGCIVNAAMAWLIIPRNWYFQFGDDSFIYNSWRIYLSSCGLPILIGALGLSFFPESPKFLMSQGRNEEALSIFRSIYVINKKKSAETYSIKVLENELTDEIPVSVTETRAYPKSFKSVICQGLLQMKPLFMGSNLMRLLLMVTIQFGGMLCANTLRLWQPQLFATLNHYQGNASGGALNLTFCEILDTTNTKVIKVENIHETEPECIVKHVDSTVYIFTLLVSTAITICLLLATALVNIVNNKNLLILCFVVSTSSILLLNWASHYTVIILLTSFFVGLMSTTTTLVISVTVNLFPTSLRTMAVSLAMMVGRIGALSGNILFPIFLDYGCIVTVISLAVILIVSLVLTIFIPKSKNNVK